MSILFNEVVDRKEEEMSVKPLLSLSYLALFFEDGQEHKII